jgi:hypothetical protein
LTDRSRRLWTAVMFCWIAGGAELRETEVRPPSVSAITCWVMAWMSMPSTYSMRSGWARRTGSADLAQCGLRTNVPPSPGTHGFSST